MREYERSNDRSRPGIDQDLADRLDRLSREDAERVLESAIRLHTQRHSAETFTAEEIRRIARELGLEDEVVDRAIHDELSQSPPPRSGASHIRDRITVSGPAAEVHERIVAWMENEEGLRPVARTVDGMRWEKDTHWLTSTRLALGTDSTKVLRGMSGVTHCQLSLGPDQHVVEIEVDSRRVRWTAWGVGGGVSTVGVGGGVLAAGLMPGGSDLVQFVSVAAPVAAAAAISAVTTARVWTRSIQRGVERALSGIAYPELHSRAARRRERRRRREERKEARSGFQRLVDEAADAIDGLFD